ncbi:MAG: OsmC family protein [Pirellulaceae bacterium]|jgi:organic hydroperoxide reductase OsmC/OhrA
MGISATATVIWTRQGAPFLDLKYSRSHQWMFDGGIVVPASSSPQIVPIPMSAEHAVDPEEALIASLSSCHMLWFLSIAATRGFLVNQYRDKAIGSMGTDQRGRRFMERVVLRPVIQWESDAPSEAEVEEMHQQAHHECFIANSVRTEVLIDAAAGSID